MNYKMYALFNKDNTLIRYEYMSEDEANGRNAYLQEHNITNRWVAVNDEEELVPNFDDMTVVIDMPNTE